MADTNQAASIAAQPVVIRQHLLKLEPLCRGLAALLESPESAAAGPAHPWHAITATCVLCNIQVSGEELLALSQPPSAEHATIKIGRLRLGDCARHGCDSYYYQLRFEPVEGVDWPALLQHLQDPPPGATKTAARSPAFLGDLLNIARHRLVPRLALALLALLSILILRQWYIGGRIFLLREPQQFYSAPPPQIDSQAGRQ